MLYPVSKHTLKLERLIYSRYKIIQALVALDEIITDVNVVLKTMCEVALTVAQFTCLCLILVLQFFIVGGLLYWWLSG